MQFRQNSVLTGRPNLEHLHTFKNYPVFVGCTDQDLGQDIKYDMSFSICRDTGIIQLDNLLPLNLVYLEQHNDGAGQIWNEHYNLFCEFFSGFAIKDVLEIGAANGHVAKRYTSNHDTQWTIVEPNPVFMGSGNIRVIKQWFNSQFKFNDKINTIVHTHVLEHVYEPIKFLQDIYNMLEVGQQHVFSIPNMLEQLKNKYTNCLNFEHTLFLTEDIVDYLLQTVGFDIVDKQYFQDHSIFYSTVKSTSQFAHYPMQYDYYKQLFMEFVQYYDTLIVHLNNQLRLVDNTTCNVYLFGGHIFSQHLLTVGLDKAKIKCVLDNSPLKQNKRLYGTNLIVRNPEIIRQDTNPIVILKVGAYREEISKQLYSINANVKILE